MRRRAPRPVAVALDRVLGALEPATVLAEVQRAWPGAVGDVFAAACRPVAEQGGTVRVDCVSAVYAQELALMSERVVVALNASLGRPAVKALRTGVRSAER